jgi:ribosomal protein L37AE/L43A
MLDWTQRLELTLNYGSVDAALKAKAQRGAMKAKNAILNLCCPHCKIAYAEFEGCMALQCQSCQHFFAGYCHQPIPSSRGTHEHVRQCLINETNNGSYFASNEEIARAQSRFLRQLKKDLQNAIVIELAQDLNDVGIQPDALFEIGNLIDDYDNFE